MLRVDLNQKQRSKNKIHMTNVRVGMINGNASKLSTHASKIEVKINGHDVLDVLIDNDFAVNIMFERLLLKWDEAF